MTIKELLIPISEIVAKEVGGRISFTCGDSFILVDQSLENPYDVDHIIVRIIDSSMMLILYDNHIRLWEHIVPLSDPDCFVQIAKIIGNNML